MINQELNSEHNPAASLAGKAPSTGNEQIDSFLADYEIRADEGVYSLTDHDRWVIANFLIELDEEVPFLAAPLAAAVPAEEASDLTASSLLKLWERANAAATDTMPAPFQFAKLLLANNRAPAEPAPILASALTDELESLMDSLSIARTSLPPGGVEQAKKALRSFFARLSKPTAQGTASIDSIDRHIAAQATADRDAQQWISVDERLPERGQQVIVYRPTALLTHDDPVRVVRYTGSERESWQKVKHGFDCICHPTHWMPLPSQPAASHGAVEGEQNKGGGHA